MKLNCLTDDVKTYRSGKFGGRRKVHRLWWVQGWQRFYCVKQSQPYVSNRIPEYLKIFKEDEFKSTLERAILPEFERLWSIFPEVTGLRLKISERQDKGQLTFPWSESEYISYKVAIEPTKRAKLYSLNAAKEMEAAFSELLTTLSRVRGQLKQREAELAASVPVISVDDDGVHLAERLESVLRGTAEFLDCFGAGLYLLDESTTSLTLRAHHGLGDNAILSPPRRLEESLADVEALSGNAVVIEDTGTPSSWRPPVNSQSAICVPVSSATTILGTLWMYRDHPRDFSPPEQNLAEITAGRLVADLERSVLTQEVRALRKQKAPERNTSAAWSEGRIAHFAPFIDGWDVADCRTENKTIGDFTHWQVIRDDRVHLAVGASHGQTDRQFSSIALQSMHAAHTAHDPGVTQLFNLANQTLWTSSIEGDASSLFHGILDPTCGSLEYALAGGVFGYILRPHGWEPLLAGRTPIGVDCDFKPEVHRQMLMPGDLLVVVSSPMPNRSDESEKRITQIAERMLHYTHLPSVELTDLAAEELERIAGPGESLAVLVAKRDD